MISTLRLPTILIIAIGTALTMGTASANRLGPPPEALEVCAQKSIGTSCGFSHRDHDITGTCEIRRDRNVCVPKHRRGKHSRHSDHHSCNEHKLENQGGSK